MGIFDRLPLSYAEHLSGAIAKSEADFSTGFVSLFSQLV